ncbi:hypothetical protein F3J19_27380 [Burkholderia sp. Ax-1724]|nr:hypothetical protein [Burkholderia sp. Ax-1724]NIF80235.1 hypothetical protein [Paraburkholderia sp. Cy-641]
MSKSGGSGGTARKGENVGEIDTDPPPGAPFARPAAPSPARRRNRRAQPSHKGHGTGNRQATANTGPLRRIVPFLCDSVRRVRYLFIIKAILKDSKVVVCWIVKAFARTSASSS